MSDGENPENRLFGKRLLFVTGKGGVGKTTVAAALGLVAARSGLRTLVVELSEQERLGALFGHAEAGFREIEVAPDLHTMTVDPQHAIDEYLLWQIKIKPLHDLLFKNRIFEYFAAATPGMKELVTIGKVWELAQENRMTKGAHSYDVVIVDGPATGHGIATLEAPNTFRDIARVGPIHHQAGKIASFLHDTAFTGIVGVATPEEMPVNETFSLQEALRDRLDMDIDLVVVNGRRRSPFSNAEAEELERAQRTPAVETALAEHQRDKTQARQMRRIRKDLGRPVVELPFLFERSFGRSALEELAEALEDQISGDLRAAEAIEELA